MEMLKVSNLCKKYEKFYLDHVSFSLDEGYIMGFIGSNGAGKTTTLKGILNLIHTDNGEVSVLGKPFSENELEFKQDIAFMTGGCDYYLKKKVKTVADTVSRFYRNWDDNGYEKLLKRFEIDPDKKIAELSQGMRVKFSLSLALSHKARLIILDEPTSGLDPVARDDMLELFQELIEDGNRSILFSTHITSDLEKCADYITYINNGRIIESSSKDELLDSYRIVNGSEEELSRIESELVSFKRNSFGFLGLIKTDRLDSYPDFNSEEPSLDDIMIYHSKKEKQNA